MINNIAYFPLQCALNSPPVMQAILKSLQTAGIATVENSMSADAAIIWSVLWQGRMQANQQVYQHYRSQNKPVVVVEIGALHRGVTWKISVNHVTAQGYYGHTDNLDWDRPRKLNISLKSPHNLNSHIVIALQHTRSLQVADQGDLQSWLLRTISILRANTDRPIVVRPHPRCKVPLSQLPADIGVEQPTPLSGTYDSFDMKYNCHAVVNYNSGPGIQAAINGTRPIVDVSSLAYPVGVDYAEIEQPYIKDRDLWLTQICHTEYTLDELQAGTWLKRIEPALNK